MSKTLQEHRLVIAEYGPMVDTPSDVYAHNIVGIVLSQIAEEYGVAAANEAIEDFGLEDKGWSTRPVPDACCDGIKGACCNDLVDHPPSRGEARCYLHGTDCPKGSQCPPHNYEGAD